MNGDPGLQGDALLSFVGTAALAYGLGSKNFGVALAGAALTGWFGSLLLQRLGGIISVVDSLTNTSGASQPATADTNGAGQGTP